MSFSVSINGTRRPPLDTLDQTIVTIKVGPSSQPYSVHKGILCHYSTFFRKCLSGYAKEARERSMALTDLSTKTFGAFLEWTYTQKLGPETDLEETDVARQTDPFGIFDEDDGVYRCPLCVWEIDEGICTKCGTTFVDVVDCQDDDDCDIETEGTTSGEEEEDDVLIIDDSDAVEPQPPPQPESKVRKSDVKPAERALDILQDSDLLDLYIFAHKYGVLELRRDVMTLWITQDREQNTIPDWTEIVRGFKELPESSPLCQYFIQTSAYYWVPAQLPPPPPAQSPHILDSSRESIIQASRELTAKYQEEQEVLAKLPKAFILGVMLIALRRARHPGKGETVPFEQDLCQFHEHTEPREEATCRREREFKRRILKSRKLAFEAEQEAEMSAMAEGPA